MQIEIRTYRSGDRDACRSLWAELVERHRLIYEDPTIGGDDPGREFDDHLLRAGHDRTWLAVVDGTVVGLTALLVSGEEAEVEPVVVTAGMRSSGIGAILVARARSEAVSLGVRFLNVSPVARNVEAISFFVREGFDVVGHVNLFQDLGGEVPRSWRSGLALHGEPPSY
ncbi:MAG: GNAT family N-acetyltransferase [Dehalococcoidia bacterium]|nr:GNAT family N-acetyltransferase [Dehalococcoidia bacterium]